MRPGETDIFTIAVMFDDIFGWTHAVKFRFYFSVIQGGPITLVPLADNYGNNHKKEKFSRTTDWSSIVAWGQNWPEE